MRGVVDGGAGLQVGGDVEGGVVRLEGLGVAGGTCDVGGEPVEELDAGAVAGDVEVDEHEDGFAAAGPDGGGDLGGGFGGFCLRVGDGRRGRKTRYVPARGRRLPGWFTLVSSQVTLRSGEPRTGNPGATVAATWATRPAQRAQLRFTMVAVGRYVGR